MKRKILTKIVSICLVICLMVPVITSLGIDLGVTSSASMVTSSSTAYFKAGTANYSKNGAKLTAANETIAVDGKLYIPASTAKEVFDATVFAALETSDGENIYHHTVTIDGISYIPVVHGAELVKGSESSVTHTGIYIYVSNMNLIALSTSTTDVFADATDSEQVDLMKRFVFDSLDASKNTVDVIDVSSISENTDGFDHPYLYADQEEFDYLHSVYAGEIDEPTLKGYLDTLVAQGVYSYNMYTTDGVFNQYANLVGGQTSLSDMPYYTGDGDTNNGYDVGGRQGEAASRFTHVARLAYAYQITREEKYASIALDFALAICQWEHWGAGHFLNVADASYQLAIAYDWCYDIWGELDVDKRDQVRDALFTKGVMAGVYDNTYLVGTTCPWVDNKVSHTPYARRANNWNAVCSNGMIVAALALLGETGDWTSLTYTAITRSGQSVVTSSTQCITNKYLTTTKDVTGVVGTTYQQTCTWIINNTLASLEEYGLGQYVPDGSYIESASYWNYGTTSFFKTVTALDITCGTDYGLGSAWGMDRTAYYSYNVQTADGTYWRYHDDNNNSIPTDLNSLFATVIDDDNIIAFRKYLISSGSSSPSFYDTFRYDSSVTEFSEMALDSYMEGIQGFTVRDSWQQGSVFAAFMGGSNKVAHSQIDSGAFVYHNNGIAWFNDIGTDNYNVYSFGYGTGAYSPKYYPVSAEGNNVLVTTGISTGQEYTTSSADIIKHGSNDYGAYAVLDQYNMYSSVATSAKRGLLMTNNRQTVVIQDEVTFTSAQTTYWFGHVTDAITITVSSDGRTAYLSYGEDMIRASIVSSDTTLKFTVMDCAYGNADNFVLSMTDTTGTFSTDNGGQPQNDYSSWQKLAIKGDGVTNLKLAVVIEEVAPGDNGEVNYEWVDMDSWCDTTPTADGRRTDNTTLLDLDFDYIALGSVESNVANLSAYETRYLSSGALKLAADGTSNTAFSMTIDVPDSKSERANIGNGMLVYEMDLATESGAPSGLTFSVWGTDIYPIFEHAFDSTFYGTLSGVYTHITLVIDEGTNMLYVFAGDTLMLSESFKTRSYQDLEFRITTEAVSISASDLLIDNIRLRSFTETYTELDVILAAGSGIASWIHRDSDRADFTGPVATVMTDETAESGVDVYSFSELASMINSGSYEYVELYASNTTAITITKPVVIDTNGYDLYATSSSYICQVDGDIRTYKKGQVVVSFYVDGVKYTSTFKSSVVATRSMSSISVSSDIIERETVDENGNTIYKYYTNVSGSWSNSEYGEALSGRDLVITSENKTFYIARTAYTGSYVTVTDGVVSAGGTDTQFFTAYMRGCYDRISLTNDISYGSVSSTSVTGVTVAYDVNLYLNGYTITYATGRTSGHMFTNSSKVFNIYGPGEIVNNSTAANVLFMPYSGSTTRYYTTIHNVNITSAHTMFDQRSGTLELIDCTISLSNKNRTFFSVVNYISGNKNSYSHENQLAQLILNGGTVNAQNLSANHYVAKVEDNSRIAVKGGVVFNCAVGNTPIALLNNVGIDLMCVELGEYYSNSELICVLSDSITDDQLESLIHYTDGLCLSSESTAYPLSGGIVVARTGNSVLPYMTVSTADVVTVEWQAGASSVTQYWIPGTVPTAIGEARTALEALTPSEGMRYVYDLSALDGGLTEAGQSYTFTAVEVRDITVSTSLTVNKGFTVNFIYPETEGVRYKYFYSTENKNSNLEWERQQIGGTWCYVVSVDVAPRNAADAVTVHAVMDDSGTEVTRTSTTSIINYAAEILADSSQSVKSKLLVTAMLDYIEAVVNYSAGGNVTQYVTALKEAYPISLSEYTLYAKTVDTTALKGIMKSVYLDLGSAPAYVFRFAEGYTGTVTFRYVTLESEGVVIEEVNVVNGKVDGSDTYRLEMSMHDFSHDVRIVADGHITSYGISAYYAQAVGANDELYALLKALYTYSLTARSYGK